MALVADDAVHLILGAKWDSIAPIIPWLALSYGLLGLTGCVYNLLESMGRANLSARLQWTRVLALGLVSFPVAFYYRNLEAVAFARFAVCCAITPSLFFALRVALGMSSRDLGVVLWRPFTAGLLMALVVLGLNAALPLVGTTRLLMDVLSGACSFTLALLVLGYLVMPAGPDLPFRQRAIKIILGRNH
jgi:O-antigen/teichoic acid export membrane protein